MNNIAIFVVMHYMVIMEDVVSEEQARFRLGRSTTGQIFTLSSIVEKHWKSDVDLNCLFVDFIKAIESV